MTEKKKLKKQSKKLMRKIQKELGLKIAARQFDHRRLSPYGGYIDVLNFSHILGLRESIVQRFQPERSTHRIYSDADILQRLLDLKPGNFVPSADEVTKLITKCLALVPSHLKVTRVRLDSGFWSFPVLNLLEKNKLEYFVKGTLRNNTPLIDLPFQIPEKNWTRILRSNIWVSHKMNYYSSDYKKTYPVIFIRERIKELTNKQLKLNLGPIYSYRPLFSNSSKSPVEIYKTYNKGALVEDVIKELKQEFFLEKIASHKFKANYAFFKIKAIAYNIINAFKRLVLKGLWSTKSAKAIKSWIIKTPCIISSRGKGMKLIYGDNLKLRTFLNSVSDRVWQIAAQTVS